MSILSPTQVIAQELSKKHGPKLKNLRYMTPYEVISEALDFGNAEYLTRIIEGKGVDYLKNNKKFISVLEDEETLKKIYALGKNSQNNPTIALFLPFLAKDQLVRLFVETMKNSNPNNMLLILQSGLLEIEDLKLDLLKTNELIDGVMAPLGSLSVEDVSKNNNQFQNLMILSSFDFIKDVLCGQYAWNEEEHDLILKQKRESVNWKLHKRNILFFPIWHERVDEIAKKLKIDLNYQDDNGDTCTHFLLRLLILGNTIDHHRIHHLITHLIASGADISIVNKEGMSFISLFDEMESMAKIYRETPKNTDPKKKKFKSEYFKKEMSINIKSILFIEQYSKLYKPLIEKHKINNNLDASKNHTSIKI